MIAAGDQANVFRIVDDLIRHVDRVQHRPQIKTVGNVVLVVIAARSAQRQQQEQRDLIGVVDFGDGVDNGHETGCTHQRGRSHRAHIGA